MNRITAAQTRKIYALSKERCIDNETLHAHIFLVTKKGSIKSLSVKEAIAVIDSLSGEKESAAGMMTEKQKKYIDGLLIRLGWTDESGRVDEARFEGLIKNRFRVMKTNWITSKVASQIIEALKEMTNRGKYENIERGELRERNDYY